MNNILSKIFIFAAGAAIGSAVTWKYFKNKYERIANEEIESVKTVFGKNHGVSYEELKYLEHDVEVSQKAAEQICEQAGYANIEEMEENEEMNDKPYVISPEEFGDGEYAIESLTYFADKVLVDDYGEVIADPDELVGEEALDSFGEYEDDSVFVRNDRLETDYEILLDVRKYSDIEEGQ